MRLNVPIDGPVTAEIDGETYRYIPVPADHRIHFEVEHKLDGDTPVINGWPAGMLQYVRGTADCIITFGGEEYVVTDKSDVRFPRAVHKRSGETVILALGPDTPCPDCRGTGSYAGLATVETCRTCGGTGVS